MLYALLAAALVAVDQVVKYWVRANIPPYGSLPFLPHVMDLTYVQNTGAAFSLFSEHTWLLTILSAVIAVLVAVALFRKLFTHPAGQICLTLVLAGAVGNLIDRFCFGFVTDMFMTTFVNFAVFNVADICVVLGGIATCLYIFFFYEKLEKREEKPHDTTQADS
ncbi:MAG: signal peptidase II [Pseudoflavonifractor sp.]